MAGVIKVLLAMRHGTIPASLHFEKLNPFIRLDDTPFHIVDRPSVWERAVGASGEDIPRRAGISSFGFGGANAHLVLEEGPRAGEDERPVGERDYLFAISGRTEEALRRRIRDLLEWLRREGSKHALAGISRALNEGRGHYKYRVAIIAGSLAELIRGLEELPLAAAALVSAGNGAAPRHGSSGRVQEVLLRLAQPHEALNGSYREHLQELGGLYLAGEDVNWSRLYANGPAPRRVSLPAYPFANTRFWAPRGSGPKETGLDRGPGGRVQRDTIDSRDHQILSELEEGRIGLDEAEKALRRK